jgi:muconolactone delta-isomerase
MEFLVEMEIGVPPDYDPELLADLLKRERVRAAEIASGDFFKMVWIVPGQRARIMICSAADARELHDTISSLPAAKWNRYHVTPVIECGVGSSICIPN